MKIGDYVRLNNGVYGVVVINRIAEIYEDTILTENDGSMYQGEYAKEEIIKSSPNIIDLIEVGDYVNGEKIIKITNEFADRKILIWGFDDGQHQIANVLYKEDIKSIITKEQIEQMEYKL